MQKTGEGVPLVGRLDHHFSPGECTVLQRLCDRSDRDEIADWALSAVLLYQTTDLSFGRHIQVLNESQLTPFAKVSRQDLSLRTQNIKLIGSRAL